MSDNNQDARHPATQIQLLQARRRGDFPRSQELSASIQLFLGVGAIYFLIKSLTFQFTDMTYGLWSRSTISYSSDEQFSQLISNCTWTTGKIVLPLLCILLLISVFSHVIQNTTLTFFNKSFFEFGQLNPANGIQRIFSSKNLFRAVLGIPKILILITVFGGTVWQIRDDLINLSCISTNEMANKTIDCVFVVLLVCTATMLVMSLMDYIIERVSFANRHRMTDQQLRDENRMQESDPQLNLRRQKFYHDATH